MSEGAPGLLWSLAQWGGVPRPAHVLLSWQPLENMKLSKCWSSAFSFMRCSSKESTSLSLCSITRIISLNISCSSFRSFSSFWLSTKKKKKIKNPNQTNKKPYWTSGKIWSWESSLTWAFLIVLDLFLPFNFHGENKEMNLTPGTSPPSHNLERWVLCALLAQFSS